MIRSVPLRPEHLDRLELGRLEIEAISMIDQRYLEVLRHHIGPARVFIDGHRVLGAFGILDTGNGDGWAWALFSDEARRRPFSFHRLVKRELEEAQGAFRKLFGTVRPDYTTGKRWLERLGFVKDGSVFLGQTQVERYVKWVQKQ